MLLNQAEPSRPAGSMEKAEFGNSGRYFQDAESSHQPSSPRAADPGVSEAPKAANLTNKGR